MPISEKLKEGYSLLDIRLFEVGGTTITAATLITFVLIVVGTIWISRLVRRALHRVFEARAIADKGGLAVASSLLHYLMLSVGIGIGLHTIGVNLTALFAAGALFAVGIGFAMQNLTENFVSGVILLVERSIKPGDILELDGQMIQVRELGTRATVARTLDEEDLIVPNSQLVQSTVKNYTLRDTLYRLRTLVGVTYGSDMELAQRTLEEAAAAIPWRNQARKPRILMIEFADSSVNFEISIWIEDPWSARTRKSDLNREIWGALKAAGVVIAFPQLDVHFDPPVVDSLQQLRRAV